MINEISQTNKQTKATETATVYLTGYSKQPELELRSSAVESVQFN